MKPSVYLETTIVSYLVGRLNRDLTVAAHQEVTRRWWSERRSDYDLVTSIVVLDEARKGDPALAAERLALLEGIVLLDVTSAAFALSQRLVTQHALPSKAEIDALHIAVAAFHGIGFLTTWNCRHIANAIVLPSVYSLCRQAGYEPPIVCTPMYLVEGPP